MQLCLAAFPNQMNEMTRPVCRRYEEQVYIPLSKSLEIQLAFLRTTLLPRAQAVYLLSDTPFVGNMNFDMIETVKSLATSPRCVKWTLRFHDENRNQEGKPGACYMDEALQNLFKNWD